ncbi:type II secretion system F family protein [Vibrio sp. F74]|uniref:type II secretion system F family protein n=1 Tax=Vibrio sp. F74 TaxID=700020 RepID=UPI0036F32A73
MTDFLEEIGKEQLFIIGALWLVALGLGSFVYMSLEQFRRNRKLRLLGLIEIDEKISKQSIVKSAVTALVQLFAASKHEITEKFIAAGFYHFRFAYLFLPLKYALLFLGLIIIIAFGIYLNIPTSTYMITAIIWLVIAIILPDVFLAARSKALQRKLSDRLPYLLDLMGVCVQTGMTIESTFAYLAQEMIGFDRDVAYMLKRTNDRSNIVGLAKAIEELYVRIPTPEFRSFIMTLNQSLQYGSSIYTVLTTLAVDIREVQMLNLEEKIGKLAAKMSIPLILFIMFPIVILITAPGIMRMMQ